MKRLLIGSAASLLAAGFALAQTPPTSNAPPPGSTTGTSMGAPANPSAPTPPSPSAKAAASGQDNQAVATTEANADQPAKGANSFTKGQARKRIQHKGYSHVTGLTKDQDGVWRGTAQRDGQSVNVWLDYKGNIGTSS
jgi:hypothetical protein